MKCKECNGEMRTQSIVIPRETQADYKTDYLEIVGLNLFCQTRDCNYEVDTKAFKKKKKENDVPKRYNPTDSQQVRSG